MVTQWSDKEFMSLTHIVVSGSHSDVQQPSYLSFPDMGAGAADRKRRERKLKVQLCLVMLEGAWR